MKGEIEIVTNMAKDLKLKGDSCYWACKNAMVEYNLALREALEYKYEPVIKNPKGGRKKSRKNIKRD